MRELFFNACSGTKLKSRPPVWFMRQAGRYLPEYREVRKNVKFLELCLNSELAAEISLQPVELLGVDIAIIFSDILLPLLDIGISVDFPEDGGIKIEADILQLPQRLSIGQSCKATCSAISILQEKLKNKQLDVPVLGFAGSPWTLLNYIIEGGSSKQRDFIKAKQMAWTNPKLVHSWLSALADLIIQYLKAQIEAGAEGIQLFDTWAGDMSVEDFENFVLPYNKYIFSEIKADIPKIFYMKGISPYIELVQSCGAKILSLDWKINLLKADKMVNNKIKCFQGNLDPLILTIENTDIVKEKTKLLLKQSSLLNRGHIINLGHGITPNANLNSVKAFIETVKYTSS